MDKNYIRYKLESKIDKHYMNAGIEKLEYDISSLIEKVNLLGDYKIIWSKDMPNDIVMLDFEHHVEVMRGIYYIYNKKREFTQQLYSSEFISFDLKEMREYKLNKILKERI